MFADTPTNLDELQLPVHTLNEHAALLRPWLSETLGHTDPLADECQFFNFSQANSAEYCDSFTVSRTTTSTIEIASSRALKCAAISGVECVLSTEIGLAIPAVFLATHEGVTTIIAPRQVPLMPKDAAPDLAHVRISVPHDSFRSKTLLFNNSLRAEYLTDQRRIDTRNFVGDDAFCISLLRIAFERDCWKKLDGE